MTYLIYIWLLAKLRFRIWVFLIEVVTIPVAVLSKTMRFFSNCVRYHFVSFSQSFYWFLFFKKSFQDHDIPFLSIFFRNLCFVDFFFLSAQMWNNIKTLLPDKFCFCISPKIGGIVVGCIGVIFGISTLYWGIVERDDSFLGLFYIKHSAINGIGGKYKVILLEHACTSGFITKFGTSTFDT